MSAVGHSDENEHRFNYYVGLRIEESAGHHCTLAFLKKATTADLQGAIGVIKHHLGGGDVFSGTRLALGEEDMFGPHKDIRVRKLSYQVETQSGKMVSDLVDQLYEKYGNKDYPKNPHISANGTINDEIIFNSSYVTGSVIYVKRIGANARIEFESGIESNKE